MVGIASSLPEPVFDCLISKMTSPSRGSLGAIGEVYSIAATARPSRRRRARGAISSQGYTRQLRRPARSADTGRIGVLIHALNYPLSWARRRPLVKIPLLFVLKRRGASPGCFGCLGCFGGRFAYVPLPLSSPRRTASGWLLIAAVRVPDFQRVKRYFHSMPCRTL